MTTKILEQMKKPRLYEQDDDSSNAVKNPT